MSPRMHTTPPTSAARRRRRGFTLIELLIVIVIIAVLVGLLLTAIGPIRSNLRVAQVKTEIGSFESGITQFKGEFGQEPPSRITLYEAASGWASDVQSSNTIRALWPQFDFTLDRDLNQDGDTNDGPITLTGDECLLFFLGGANTIVFFNSTSRIYGDVNGDGEPEISTVADGFSKNPQDPFAKGGSRIGPFAEFDPDRMVDLDGDEAFSYADAFPSSQTPYIYYSSYDGRGYRPLDGDLNQNGTIDVSPADDAEMKNVYRQSATVAWKDKSYQIISAGEDGLFGIGGGWSSENGVENVQTMKNDQDNVTNFSSGVLD